MTIIILCFLGNKEMYIWFSDLYHCRKKFLVLQPIYTHRKNIKAHLLHQSLVPVSVFLSLFLSFSQANSLECRSLLSSLSCPGLQDPRERVPCAYVKQCKPCVKGFIGFLCKPRNISLSLSLFYFLIVDSRPPGSSPFRSGQSLSRVQSIKGPQLVAPRTGTWYTWQIRTE